MAKTISVDDSRNPKLKRCGSCKFFERNKNFPNRYGKCIHSRYPNDNHFVTDEVHDSFGCVNYKTKE